MEEKFELQVFDLTTAALAEMKTSFMALKVCGVDDSKGFDQVHAARMIVKRTRVQVEKRGLELRKEKKKEIEDYLRSVSDTEKFIVGELFPVETYLQSQEDIITQEKARIKAEEDAKEAARIQVRIDTICSFGASFNGQMYSAFGIQIPTALVKVCTDEQFSQFIAKLQVAKDTAEAETKAKEEALKALADQQAKIAAEQETERQRLAEIARKQAEEAARIKSEQDAIEAEKKRLADADVARLKAIEDEKARVENEKKRQAELEQARKEAAEKALKDAEEKAKQEAEAKIEKERLAKIAADKKEARAPDREKLFLLADSLEVIPQPTMKTPEGTKIIVETGIALKLLVKSLREKVEAL